MAHLCVLLPLAFLGVLGASVAAFADVDPGEGEGEGEGEERQSGDVAFECEQEPFVDEGDGEPNHGPRASTTAVLAALGLGALLTWRVRR